MVITARKIAFILMLAAFSSATFFGFSLMIHEGGGMMPDCPFSPGQILCAKGFSAAMHHASSYYSFINVTLAIFVLIAFAGAFSALFPRCYICARFSGARRGSVSILRRKISEWLSLFELSPSLS